MAYDVEKTVNGRTYRYRVRSERDPATGKTRNRWTYLGRATVPGNPLQAPRARKNAREAVLDALERLLDRHDYGSVTAAAVSVEAGLAHGTFYRYFRNKQEALHALFERVRESEGLAIGRWSAPTYATREEARSALRDWLDRVFRTPSTHRGVMQAKYAVAAADAVVAATQRTRRQAFVDAAAAQLARLAADGFAPITDPANLAHAIFGIIDGFIRDVVGSSESFDVARAAALTDVVERAIFGVL